MDRNTIIGLVVGVLVSWFISSYFHRRNLHSKRISIKYQSWQLYPIENYSFPNDFELNYKGRTIKKVFQVYLYIWNSGEKSISRSDVLTLDPVRVRLEGNFDVLSLTLEKYSNPNNETKLLTEENKENKSFVLEFSYLHPQQGIRISVLLTGNLSNVQGSGTLLDSPNGLLVSNIESSDNLVDFLAISLGLSSLFFPFFLMYFFESVMKDNVFLVPLFAAVPILFASAFPATLRRHYPRTALPPSSLRGPAKHFEGRR